MTTSDFPTGPIGIFDSGYGGLTVYEDIKSRLPEYDFIYFGDNARSPYGTRDFETIYQYTWQAVDFLFNEGCHLIILACNTASARALRNIQQLKLIQGPEHRRVLGVIRPTTEVIGNYSATKNIGILATSGTIASQSYPIEIQNFFPDCNVSQQACPLWVPLIEHGEQESEGAIYFYKKYINELLQKAPDTDTLLLACTHYPLIMDKIREHTPGNIKIIGQGELVALSLEDYLQRHPELDKLCNKNGKETFLTSGDAMMFEKYAEKFIRRNIVAERIDFLEAL